MPLIQKLSAGFIFVSAVSYLILFMVRYDAVVYYQAEGAKYFHRRIADRLKFGSEKNFQSSSCGYPKCLPTSSIVFVVNLLNDSTVTRDLFRGLWYPMEVTCSYQLVFLVERDNGLTNKRSVDDTNCDENVVYFDGSLNTNISPISDDLLANAVEEQLLAKFCTSNSTLRLVVGTGVTISSDGVTANYLRELSLPFRDKSYSKNDTNILETFNRCTGFEPNSTKEKYPVPYMVTPANGHPSAWEVVARSNMTTQQTKWLRFLLMHNQSAVVNPDTTTTIIEPMDFCNDTDSTWLIIMVHTNPTSYAIREKVRTTWAHPAILGYTKAIRFFVMGATTGDIQAKILNESAVYNDILQGDFVDAYRNLTLKQRLGYRFISEKCSHTNYRYVLKIDDDVLADLRSISSYFTEVAPHIPTFPKERGFYCSHLVQDEEMSRSQEGKWYIAPEEYAGETYPAYCYGGAYLISADLVKLLYNTSFYTRHYWVDDVYFSGFVARNIGNVSYVQLPQQDPMPLPSDPEEIVLKRKKWFLHALQNVDVLQKYFLVFDSRWNLDSRRKLIQAVTNRTDFNFTMATFDYL